MRGIVEDEMTEEAGRKPVLSEAAVTSLLRHVLGEEPRAVEPLVEGLESQAFRFETGDGSFVLRINRSLRGFEKDRWASSTLGERLPVPRVVRFGPLERGLAYCISEWVPGETLEALAVGDVEQLVGEVARVWSVIAETDVSAIDGFGDFDADGHAPARSWHEVLAETAEDARRELGEADGVIDAYERLIVRCPNERGLIHGDFGSNNVLAAGRRVTAVLDWDQAMVGDPLYDVANVYFWAPHLACMDVQASYFERTLSNLPAYRERISCYAARIGLEEARDSSRDGDLQLAEWALARARALLPT